VSILTTSLLVVHATLASLIILLTLFSAPKSGLSSLGGASQQLGSKKSADKAFVQFTMVVVALFFISGFVLGYYIKP
jgi:protein translocase SecG subunit